MIDRLEKLSDLDEAPDATSRVGVLDHARVLLIFWERDGRGHLQAARHGGLLHHGIGYDPCKETQ